jgi:N-terminal domain of galactosyltransferase/N-terminal region of glycosyl transferase group 7
MEKQRGLVLVTYRNRPTHLECLIGQLQRHWPELTIAVIEQADDNAWNKGLLYNIGYKLLAQDYDYLILHDVDFIPVWDQVDYSPTPVPCMIAGAASQFDYRLYYPTFFGGVIVCSKDHYELINGFSNKFRGYGGEDDLTRASFVQKGIQPTYKMGRFECFAHPKPDIRPGSSFYHTPEYQHNLQLATSPRDFTDGVSNSMDYIRTDPAALYNLSTGPTQYKHIKVYTHG